MRACLVVIGCCFALPAVAREPPRTLVESSSIGRSIPVATARRVPLDRAVAVAATLTYDVDHYAEATMPRAGRIARMAVRAGDEVRRDAVVAALEGGRVLRAPIAGTVVRAAASGDRAAAGDTVCAIADLDWLSGYAFVDAAAAARLHAGARALLRTSDAPPIEVTGRVSRVERWTRDPARAFRVRIEVANVRRELRPGLTLRGTVVDDEAPSVYAVVVPRAAVVADGDTRVVFVREDAGRFRRQVVHLGAGGSDWIEITDGVSEGQVVAVGGFDVLQTRIITSNDQGGAP